MNSMILKFVLPLAFAAGVVGGVAGVDASQLVIQKQPSVQVLPTEAVFPGPWDEYIQAPANKTHIRPKGVKLTEGNVENASAVLDGTRDTKSGLTLGPGGIVIFDFEQNIGGR